MIPHAHVNVGEFSSAIKQLARGSMRAAVSLSNQIALDITREWFNRLPPPVSQIMAKRAEIRNYLRAPIGPKAPRRKRRKAIFTPAEIEKLRSLGGTPKLQAKQPKKSPLRRMNLIVQARNRASGKGLYGAAMRRHAGGLARRALTGVGYLKIILLPVIRGLNPLVPPGFKMPFSETGGSGGGKISIWPGSKGAGIVTPARGKNAAALLNLRWSLHGPREGYARGLILGGWHRAVAFKLQKIKNRIEREMQGEFSKVNARRR